MRIKLVIASVLVANTAFSAEPVPGARIKRTQLQGDAPVTAVTRERIESEGISAIGDLMSDGSSSVRFEIQVLVDGRGRPQDYFYDLLVEDLGERQLIRLKEPDENGLLAFTTEVHWGRTTRTTDGKSHSTGSFWVDPLTLIVRPIVGSGVAVPMKQIVWLCFEGAIPLSMKGELKVPGPSLALPAEATCGRAPERGQ